MKLYKVLYTMTCQEDVVYFSASNLGDVINAIGLNKEVHSIVYLGKIEILK